MLSRDEIEAEKQRNKAIDTRPIKKVAEAKARKKKRLQASSLQMQMNDVRLYLTAPLQSLSAAVEEGCREELAPPAQ